MSENLYDACDAVYDIDNCTACSTESLCHSLLAEARVTREKPDLSITDDMGAHSCGRSSEEIAKSLLSRVPGSRHTERVAIKWLAEHFRVKQHQYMIRKIFDKGEQNGNSN